MSRGKCELCVKENMFNLISAFKHGSCVFGYSRTHKDVTQFFLDLFASIYGVELWWELSAEILEVIHEFFIFMDVFLLLDSKKGTHEYSWESQTVVCHCPLCSTPHLRPYGEEPQEESACEICCG